MASEKLPKTTVTIREDRSFIKIIFSMQSGERKYVRLEYSKQLSDLEHSLRGSHEELQSGVEQLWKGIFRKRIQRRSAEK